MMSEVFHLVVADADVYLAASEYVLEQVQVVGKADSKPPTALR